MNDSPNVQTIRRAIERWNAGDRTAPLDDVDPEIEVNTAIANAFTGEPFRGYEGVGEWLGALDESFERWDLDIDQIHERGDVAVVLGTIHTKGRGSGLELDLPTGMVIEFRDGKVIRVTIFREQDEALAAGGLG